MVKTTKKYQNPALKLRIEATINEMPIHDIYKPYIVDILMRRAAQYSLSGTQIQIDLDTISKSLINIRTKKLSALAEYHVSLREIRLNIFTILFLSNKRIYQTLAHELYHALTHDENHTDRLGRINKFTRQENYSLLEAIVEKASYRTIFSGKSKNPYWNHNADGYNSMIFIIGMLEATYGVTEQDLLKHSIQDRKDLAIFLSQKAGTSLYEELDFLDKLEANYAIIHRLLYRSNKEKDNISTKNKNLTRSLKRIEVLCAEKMHDRLSKLNYDSITSETMENFQFNYNKFHHILKRTKTALLPLRVSTMSSKNSSNELIKLRQAIEQTKALVDAGVKSRNQDSSIIIEWAKYGNAHHFNDFLDDIGSNNPRLESYGVTFNKKETNKPFKISKKIIERNQEDDYYTSEWENPQIYAHIKRDFIIGKLIKNVKMLFSGKTKALPSGHPPEVHRSTSLTKATNLALPPNEQAKINSQITNIAKPAPLLPNNHLKDDDNVK